MNQETENRLVCREFRAICREAIGPWPFITQRIFVTDDGSLRYWRSRHERKGLVRRAIEKQLSLQKRILKSLWMPDQLNWWIGVIFALGASLFIAASVFVLSPRLAPAYNLDDRLINAIYFAGSIPFTTAAYLQLYQAANAPRADSGGLRAPTGRALFGWRPENAGG